MLAGADPDATPEQEGADIDVLQTVVHVDDQLKQDHPDEWKIFDALDVDDGGTLDKDELWCKLAIGGEDQADQLMSMVDQNGDGVIDFPEFCDAFAGNQQFRQLITADTDWMHAVMSQAGFPEDKLDELSTKIEALQSGHAASAPAEELAQMKGDAVKLISPLVMFDADVARQRIANGLKSESFAVATDLMTELDDALKALQEEKAKEKNRQLGIDC